MGGGSGVLGGVGSGVLLGVGTGVLVGGGMGVLMGGATVGGAAGDGRDWTRSPPSSPHPAAKSKSNANAAMATPRRTA